MEGASVRAFSMAVGELDDTLNRLHRHSVPLERSPQVQTVFDSLERVDSSVCLRPRRPLTPPAIRSKDGESVGPVEFWRWRGSLSVLSGVPFAGEQEILDMGLFAFSAHDALRSVNTIFLILQAIFAGIGGIALLVAAFGIANTMIMAIYERTREIGLMKAIGATNRDVMTVFLAEAGAIGLLGGVLGVIVGILLSQIVNLFALSYLSTQTGGLGPSFVVYTPPWLILLSLAFATLVGLLSGIYPAMRAATLNPVSALKYE